MTDSKAYWGNSQNEISHHFTDGKWERKEAISVISNNLPSRKDIYNINYNSPGLVIIFNNRSFKENENSTRYGSEKDVECLKELFKNLKYKIQLNLDLDSAEIRNKIRDYSLLEYSNYSCLIIFIMSHGDEDSIIASDNKNIKLNQFFNPIKSNLSLKNKPKLFFIQACRGGKEMPEIASNQRSVIMSTDSNMAPDSEIVSNFKPPIEADFLYAFATVEGYYSYRL